MYTDNSSFKGHILLFFSQSLAAHRITSNKATPAAATRVTTASMSNDLSL